MSLLRRTNTSFRRSPFDHHGIINTFQLSSVSISLWQTRVAAQEKEDKRTTSSSSTLSSSLPEVEMCASSETESNVDDKDIRDGSVFSYHLIGHFCRYLDHGSSL